MPTSKHILQQTEYHNLFRLLKAGEALGFELLKQEKQEVQRAFWPLLIYLEMKANFDQHARQKEYQAWMDHLVPHSKVHPYRIALAFGLIACHEYKGTRFRKSGWKLNFLMAIPMKIRWMRPCLYFSIWK